jgi:plastocyanin
VLRDSGLENRYDIFLEQEILFMVPRYLSHYTRLLVGITVLAGQWAFPHGLYAQSEDSSLPQMEAPAGQQIFIRMESYSYTPSEVVVEAGKPITLILSNESFLVPHNFLLDDPGGIRLVDADISSGDTKVVTLTLMEPGIYPFYCDKKLLFFPSHRKQGMEGRLIVR